MVTSPRRSESRNATGGSPHSCIAKSFPLTFLKAYRGSFASVNKNKDTNHKKEKEKRKKKNKRFLDPTHCRG